jgi:hypothetical protein
MTCIIIPARAGNTSQTKVLQPLTPAPLHGDPFIMSSGFISFLSVGDGKKIKGRRVWRVGKLSHLRKKSKRNIPGEGGSCLI